MKKYELTDETKVLFGLTLYRIRALVSFGNVNSGELGGWVEKESNLEQSGNAWVSGNARVSGNAWVSGDALVSGNALVYGNADVYGNAQVSGNAEVLKPVHMMTIGAIGSRNDRTTFFRTKEKKIKVVCGCFYGTIEEFAEKVKETHNNSKHEITYSLAIELAKAQIDLT